ncbi:major capsid protein [Marinobacter sp. DS40M6]|uniref:major capsid protein n=1 Tax=Marinobacter sp. DS40M6 TaxID=1597776 RepID=UPI0023584D3B|nr:major capsid protein [Marinobacter sp. DS40M6]MDC8457827.1 major capsid protein [Marinobacter sp. DS40M6]
MAFTPYSTHKMLGVIRHLPKPSTFWLNLAFREQVNFDTQYIDFDKISKGRRIAPFVAPTVAGKPMMSEGFTTHRFKPAYVKPMHPVDPDRLITRQAGEAYTGSQGIMSRRNAIVGDILREQNEMVTRRWEVMAAEAVINGSVVVEGEDYPTQTVNFGRDANNTVTLSGTDLWTDTANSKPYKDLEGWSLQMARSAGYPVTDWIMGVNACEALLEHPDTEKQLNKDVKNSSSMMLDLGVNQADENGAIIQLKGTIGSGIRIWVYSDIYEDENGDNVEIMDPDIVVGINPAGVQGVRCFGAIMDLEASYQALDRFPKNWAENNPSVEYVMTQSAPLMVPRRPNATFKATVR